MPQNVPTTAEEVCRKLGHSDLLIWLRQSRGWSLPKPKPLPSSRRSKSLGCDGKSGQAGAGEQRQEDASEQERGSFRVERGFMGSFEAVVEAATRSAPPKPGDQILAAKQAGGGYRYYGLPTAQNRAAQSNASLLKRRQPGDLDIEPNRWEEIEEGWVLEHFGQFEAWLSFLRDGSHLPVVVPHDLSKADKAAGEASRRLALRNRNMLFEKTTVHKSR